MPTTGVSGVVSEFGPSGAPPNGTTESAPGVADAAAAERHPLLRDRNVTTAPEVVRSWVHEIITPASTSTMTAAGNPTVRKTREFRMVRMGDHSPTPPSRQPLEKRRDQFRCTLM